MKLSNKQLAKMPWQASARRVNAGAGLIFTQYPTGRKTWSVHYLAEGKKRVQLLGYWPEMSLAKARKAATVFRRNIASGQPFILDKAGPTVKAFSQRYMREVVAERRKDMRPIQRWLDRDILPVLGQKSVKAVTPADVQRIVFRKRDAGRKAAAVTILSVLKRLFDYAVVCGIIEANPTRRTPRRFAGYKKPVNRVLAKEELKLAIQPGSRLPMGGRMWTAMQLIILTLCRKSELLQARWGWIDLAGQAFEVPGEYSKSGNPHVVYLSRQAVDLLMGLRCLALPYSQCTDPEVCIFPMQSSATQPVGPSTLNKAMKRVKWGVPHFTPHDLRRTGCTILYELGYKSEWIEKTMNHTVPGVKGIYNKAQYADDRRRMLQEWADWLGMLCNGQ